MQIGYDVRPVNEPEAIRLFRRRAIAAVREMPLLEARAFLRGLLALTEDRPEIAHVRDIYTELCVVDDSLALIAGGAPPGGGSAAPETAEE